MRRERSVTFGCSVGLAVVLALSVGAYADASSFPRAAGRGGVQLRGGGFPHAGAGYASPRGLSRFGQGRARDARIRLRGLRRDAERRAEERRLRDRGTPADLRRYRRRVAVEDSLDHLRDLHELEASLPHRRPSAFGPVTRRLLDRSGIELRRAQRSADLERRVRELERSMLRRERKRGLFGWLRVWGGS